MPIIETYLNNFLFAFLIVLFVIYVVISVLSAFELRKYIQKNKYTDYKSILRFEIIPSVSIIAPAYNEEKSIVENIKCLLSLYYPKQEVIIVNDGSKDKTLELMIEAFDLIKVDYAFETIIYTKRVRGIYKSRKSEFSSLIVVDKENGGKGDALNAGINISRSDLFMAIDVDSIIEPDAIVKMVKPFIEEEEGRKIIASGGVVRVANSCEINNGRIVKVVYPKNIWAKFQVLEYFRAFTLGRLAWSRINGLLIISGAFGMFDRELVLKIGGYDTTTVGEDLELVVRMRRYMHEVEKKKYRIVFIPDPLCWTEVPSSLNILGKQRNRWTRGAIDTLQKHSKLFFNPRYGRMGMISFPYWVFFEWLGPMIEFSGLIFFIYVILAGLLNLSTFFMFLALVYSFSILFSFFAVFYESFTYNKYKGSSYLLNLLLFATLEMIIYHPFIVYFSIKGNFDFFILRKRHGWGKMNRVGFKSKKQ